MFEWHVSLLALNVLTHTQSVFEIVNQIYRRIHTETEYEQGTEVKPLH